MMKSEHIQLIFEALEVGLEVIEQPAATVDKPPMIGSLLPETVRGTVTIDGEVYILTVERV